MPSLHEEGFRKHEGACEARREVTLCGVLEVLSRSRSVALDLDRVVV